MPQPTRGSVVVTRVMIISQCDLIGASAPDNIRKITQLPQLAAIIQDPHSEKVGRLPSILQFIFVHHRGRTSVYGLNIQPVWKYGTTTIPTWG